MMSKELNINININGQNVESVNLKDAEIKITEQDQIRLQINNILEALRDTYNELADMTTAEKIISDKYGFHIRDLNDISTVFMKNNLFTGTGLYHFLDSISFKYLPV